MADVISRNPFALLDDEEEGVAAAPRKPAPKAAPKEIAPAAAARPEPRAPREDRPRRGGYGRGGYASAEGRDRNVPPRLARQENGGESYVPQAEGRENSRGGYRGRGRGGFRGERGGEFRGRGGRGGRGRDYDRHSATGRFDSEKQEVTGGWGAPGSELEVAPNERPIENAESAKLDSATPVDEKPAEEVKPVEKTPEELAAEEERRKEEEFLAKQKTLQQYLAEKNAAKPTLEGANTGERDLNQGVDPNLLKSSKKFERKAEEDIFFVGKTKAASAKAKAPKEQKQVVDIDFRFEDTPRRGGRGGRGGDRPAFGGRGRGGDRPSGGRGRGDRPAVNVTDQNAFPGLKK